jgi:hypothetical protein
VRYSDHDTGSWLWSRRLAVVLDGSGDRPGNHVPSQIAAITISSEFSYRDSGSAWGPTFCRSSRDFGKRTLQNWQSDFVAVGSMAILAVHLRQRGSPESKLVGAPHHATGVEG